MKKHKIYLICFFGLLSYTGTIFANTVVSAAIGKGPKKNHAYRINLQRAWHHDCYAENKITVGGYW